MPENTVTVVYKNVFPGDTFDPCIEGVDPITTTGTPVLTGQLEAVKEAAKRAGVRVAIKKTRS